MTRYQTGPRAGQQGAVERKRVDLILKLGHMSRAYVAAAQEHACQEDGCVRGRCIERAEHEAARHVDAFADTASIEELRRELQLEGAYRAKGL